MSNISHEALLRYIDVFEQASILYCSLRDPVARMPQPRRAELRQGQVAADPLDFICDFDIKAKRSLRPEDRVELMKHLCAGEPRSTPKLIQIMLGKVLLEQDMSFAGTYRYLYFRSKQDITREHIYHNPIQFVEEEEQDVQHSNALSRLEAEDSTLQEEAESLFTEVDEYRKQNSDEAVDD